MPNRFQKFVKQTQKQIKQFQKTLEKMRTEEVEEELEPIPKAPKKKKMDEVVVHVSAFSVARATIVILLLLAVGQFVEEIANILLIFFVSILFAAALDPTVDALEKRRIPRTVSVLFIILLLLGLMGLFVSQLIPLVATQLIELARNLNNIFSGLEAGNYPFSEKLQPFVESTLNSVDREIFIEQLRNALDQFASQLSSFAGDTFNAVKKIFNGVFNFILVLILTFFLTVDEQSVDTFLLSLFPSKHASYIVEKMEAIKHRIGHWLRGQVVLMVVMFFLTWITFMILGVDYAVTLAMLAGIAELIPVFGPFIAGVPALLVAFNQSYWLALWVLIAIILLQQLENNVVVPMVMRKAVGLSPIIVILAMLIGFSAFNLLGAIIAIPVATTLSIFVNDYTSKKK